MLHLGITLRIICDIKSIMYSSLKLTPVFFVTCNVRFSMCKLYRNSCVSNIK